MSCPLKAAAPTNIKRFFSVSNGLMERTFNSNEGMIHLPLSSLQLYSKFFDVIHDAFPRKLTRILLTSGDLILNHPLHLYALFNTPTLQNYFLTNSCRELPGSIYIHEFGHARALRAWNRQYTYRANQSEFNNAIGYYKHFFNSLNCASSASTLPKDNQSEWGMLAIIIAAGINNQHYLARKIEKLIDTHGGHVGYFASYFQNKLAGLNYALHTDFHIKHNTGGGKDVVKLINDAYDKNLTTNYMINSGLLACLCSGSTWSFLSGWWNYVQTGDPSVTPIRWKGFRWPDFSVYYNTNGVSVEISSSYQHSDNLSFDLSWEFICKKITSKVTDFIDRQKYKIDATWQISPGFRYTYTPPSNNSIFYFNGRLDVSKSGIGGSCGVEWKPQSIPLSFFAQYTLYNLNTLYGERNIPFVLVGDSENDGTSTRANVTKESPFCNEILVGVSYNY